MMEPVAHIVIKPNGKRSVTLATQYDPMASSFWLNGERPEGYEVEPLVRLSDAEARIAEITKWRDEWKDMATELKGLVEEWQARAEAAEALLKEAREALEPFSDMAGEMFARNWEDPRVVVALDNPGDAHRVTYADFRAARAIHHKIGGKDE